MRYKHYSIDGHVRIFDDLDSLEHIMPEVFSLFKEGGPLAVGDLKNPQSLRASSFKKEQNIDSSATTSE
jgi:hypothetical protein